MDEVSQGSPPTLFSSLAGRMFCRRLSPSQLGLVALRLVMQSMSFRSCCSLEKAFRTYRMAG